MNANWENYRGPLFYKPEEPPKAILQIERSNTSDDARRACDAFLFALGNNHSGTYYSAASLGVRHLLRIVGSDASWPCWSVLQIFMEYMTSFRPDPESCPSELEAKRLQQDVRAVIMSGKAIYERLANDESVSASVRHAAEELLSLI